MTKRMLRIMRNINLKIISVSIALLFCVVMARATAHAQNTTKAGAKQTGGKSKAAPKTSSELDEGFMPKAKPKEKPSGQPGIKNTGEAASEEIGDPSGGSTPESNSALTTTPVASVPSGSAPADNAPKKTGVMRLCLVTPRAQISAGDAAQAAEGVRNTFKSFFTGPTIETVLLTARLPSQAAEEAKQSGCEYVLYSSLTHKKGGGSSSLLGRALGDVANTAVWHIPGGSSTAGAVARSAAISGVYTAANVANSIKAKDELTLEYKLEATDGARLLIAKIEKAKAKSDGEDVLTPLIEKAAEMVAAAMMKR